VTYAEYEKVLNAVLDDEIRTAEWAGAPSPVVEYLRERRRQGNSGRVPAVFKSATARGGE